VVSCRISWPADQGDLTQGRFRAQRAWQVQPLDITWRLPGRHQAGNAAAAICLAAILGLSDEALRAALAELTLPGQRSKLDIHGGVTWFNDAYNANPESMAALLALLAERDWAKQAGRLHLALGDMREMNQDGPQFHADLLRLARQKLPAAILYPVGPAMATAAAALGITGYADVTSARAALHAAIHPGDTVALKASRGMALEGLLPGAPTASH
jgi:UDP-N-acetylmuramoyl-tripeptide--D-alanyl-D-alanine ligase